jgi:hypothetical protein
MRYSSFKYTGLLLALVIGVFSSCRYGPSDNHIRETKIFTDYLKTNSIEFDSSINKCYMIVPDNSCIGCAKYAYELVSGCPKLFVITTMDNFPEDSLLLASTEIFVDRKGTINRLNLGFRNTYLVIMEKGKITGLQQILPNLDFDVAEASRRCSC